MIATEQLRAMVDPELIPALDSIPALGDLSQATLDHFRNALSATVAEALDYDRLVIEHVIIPGTGDQPDIAGILYRPNAARKPGAALLNLHGGGYVMGSAAREDGAMRSLANDTGCVILSIDYRLAPETPFPGPLDDCWTALAWLHDRSARLAIAPDRIGVRGVSAGGGLAAALSLRARDARMHPIAFLMLVYPMLDDRTGSHPHNGHFVWTADVNRFAWSAYLGNQLASPPSDAVPARAVHLAGLPRCFIATGSIDLFAAENLEWAKRLIDVGVEVELHVYPGAYHGFPLVGSSRVAQLFERDCRAAIARALCASS